MPGRPIRSLADVPQGDTWLSARERRAEAGLHVPPRRHDRRLGRFAAKAAVGDFILVYAGVDSADERGLPR
jgi:hypothetical protein